MGCTKELHLSSFAERNRSYTTLSIYFWSDFLNLLSHCQNVKLPFLLLTAWSHQRQREKCSVIAAFWNGKKFAAKSVSSSGIVTVESKIEEAICSPTNLMQPPLGVKMVCRQVWGRIQWYKYVSWKILCKLIVLVMAKLMTFISDYKWKLTVFRCHVWT